MYDVGSTGLLRRSTPTTSSVGLPGQHRRRITSVRYPNFNADYRGLYCGSSLSIVAVGEAGNRSRNRPPLLPQSPGLMMSNAQVVNGKQQRDSMR
jgi:hypothetical protein